MRSYKMKIENAQYTKDADNKPYAIRVSIGDITWSVPPIEGNRHYDEIMKQVKEGTLTIKDVD